MIITKEDLNIDVINFLNDLDNIEGINNKAYDSIANCLKLDVIENWTEETELDNLIIAHDLSNFVFIVSSNIVNFSAKELKKKIKKESTLKNKFIQLSYNKKEQTVKFKFTTPFTQDNIDTLDAILDTLTGHDTVSERMDQYNKRKSDGWTYYNEQTSNITLGIEAGLFTTEDEDFIQLKLEKTIFYIILGQWVTALKRINETVVEGVYTQDLKNNLLLYIQNYIVENYEDGQTKVDEILNP